MAKTAIKIIYISLLWGYMPIIPALRRLRQEENKFEASQGWII
jgi:hypothetical protein